MAVMKKEIEFKQLRNSTNPEKNMLKVLGSFF